MRSGERRLQVVLARHGQTAWNREELFRGRVDVPLDEVGKNQAAVLGKATVGLPVILVVSSPLARAKETAAAVAACHGLEVEVDDAFDDIDCGAWSGLSVGQVSERYPVQFEAWWTSEEGFAFPGGESFEAARRRSMAGLRALAERLLPAAEDREPSGGAPGVVPVPSVPVVVVVSHRAITKLILLGVLGASTRLFRTVRQDTACLNVLDYVPGAYPEGFVVRSVNDVCHLSAMQDGRLRLDF